MEQATIIADLSARFEKNYGAFAGLLWALHDEDLDKVPSFGGWTAGQVSDHVIKATGGIPDSHTKETDRAFDEKVQPLADMFLDFETKMKSPPFIVPGNGPFNKTSLLQTLEGIKHAHLEHVAHKDPYALCLDMELPGFGYMTRYEWWSFLLFHLERHTHQLRGIYKDLQERNI